MMLLSCCWLLSFSSNTAIAGVCVKYRKNDILTEVVGVRLVPCFVLVLISLFFMFVLPLMVVPV